jgi:hypothetical protein
MFVDMNGRDDTMSVRLSWAERRGVEEGKRPRE